MWSSVRREGMTRWPIFNFCAPNITAERRGSMGRPRTREKLKLAQSEHSIQSTIMQHLTLSGDLVWRSNSGKVKVRGGWMQLAPEGSPDVYALKDGLLYGIEVKKPGETQSLAQALYEREFNKHGGRYYVAWSLDDVAHLK